MLLEQNLHKLFMARQAAKGTPATTAAIRPRLVDGDIAVNRSDGSEAFSDFDRFGNAADYIDTIIGQGSPGIQGTPTELAWECWTFFGAESVTAIATGVNEHVFVPGTGGAYATLWAVVGQNLQRAQKFNDTRFGSLAISASQQQKILRSTLGAMSADPGEIFAVDPSGATMPDEAPFVFTDGEGTFKIDGETFRGNSQCETTWDEGISPYYGDSVAPLDFGPGEANITNGMSVAVDDQGLKKFHREYYGTDTPAAGAKPRRTVARNGSYEFDMTKGTVFTVALTGGPTGGTFTLTWSGQTTAGIAHNATASAVQTALEALSNVEPGDVTVTGSAGTYVVVFTASGAATPTASGAALTPSGGVTVTAKGPWRRYKLELPALKWDPSAFVIPPATGGGVASIGATGAMRKVSGQPGSRITIRCAAPAFS